MYDIVIIKDKGVKKIDKTTKNICKPRWKRVSVLSHRDLNKAFDVSL